jgi:hypothetical protein
MTQKYIAMQRDTKIIVCGCGVEVIRDKLTNEEEKKYNTDKTYGVAFKCPTCNTRWIIQYNKDFDDQW